jgi:hypothetical protein
MIFEIVPVIASQCKKKVVWGNERASNIIIPSILPTNEDDFASYFPRFTSSTEAMRGLEFAIT